MPSARELLDQADALMRRNRSLVRDDIPVLTEAFSPKTAAQMTRSALVVEGLAEPREQTEATPASRAPYDVPVLTDAIAEIDVQSLLDSLETGEPSAWPDFNEDSVRSVIDADVDSIVVVPDIESPGPERAGAEFDRDSARGLQPVRDRGAFVAPLSAAQPEDVPGTAAESAVRSERSAVVEETADPDSAIVNARPTVGNVAGVDEGFAPRSNESDVADESGPQTDEVVERSTALSATVVDELTRVETETAVAPIARNDGQIAVEAANALTDALLVVRPGFASRLDEQALNAEPAAHSDEPVEKTTGLSEELVRAPIALKDDFGFSEISAARADASAPAEELASLLQEPTGPEAFGIPPRPAMEEHASPAPVPLAHDDDRWTEVADDIRTQVLQRIDVFTGTGLREVLGVHLQPIVDRASADLISTINREVGVLLRACIAEAIEREIERLRREK